MLMAPKKVTTGGTWPHSPPAMAQSHTDQAREISRGPRRSDERHGAVTSPLAGTLREPSTPRTVTREKE